MPLFVYNTLTQKKEEFIPINPPKVGMYVCGITAYDSCHLGHARAAVVFDVVYRYLKFLGYDVTFVRNYTDVDDKIINRANFKGVPCQEISEKYIAEYEKDMESLGLKKPDMSPKATEHIGCMIDTIKGLIERGMAYEVDGNVFFSVRNFKGYGKLSKKNIEELESGARVDVDESKRDPLDFALWKKAKPGEPTWPSPWGEGRPGWHIECSAMSAKYLGQPFDIHGGGRDLIFPHHENEIAQAEGATGKHFVKYWLHNGFININAEKMSKSLGNITTISKVLEQYDAEAVKLFLLSNQYRSPIDYTKTAMEEAQSSLDRFYETAARLGAVHPGKTVNEKPDDFDEARDFKKALESFESSFREDMNDDFNTARAVALAFDIVRLANRYLDKIDGKNTPFTGWSVLQFMSIQELLGETLGIFGSSPDEYRRRSITRQSLARGINVTEVKRLIEERREARLSKNFAESDRIRKELSEMGVEIKDLPDGKTDWKIK
ncbi:MAG TPA: cysteine--tRNA ligase [bacterium]|nr:cysteine--tRNA ligase [Myxococcales bacterium]OQA61099.1 MAG: Cysteine--tRNA ligase [bacterium ADurb.Bin270]HPW44986.1 cysteine--tRNA ligase [bacterium]HQC50949.1 cysteine--tRNA ligase [bacterium]HQG13902.1 cysteine--tRNA ligase [bacterium]